MLKNTRTSHSGLWFRRTPKPIVATGRVGRPIFDELVEQLPLPPSTIANLDDLSDDQLFESEEI